MTNVYNSNVLVGNWRETQCAEEEERNRIETMKKNKVSLTDRLNCFRAVLNKEIIPDKTQNYITFGSVIQLLPYYMLYNEAFGSKKSGALSIAVSADALTSGDVINELCEMRIMFVEKPTIRNSFRVISVDDENHDGEPLLFEQHFRLEVLHPTDRMFVYSAPKRIDLQLSSNTTSISYKRGEASLPLGLRFAKNIGRGEAVMSAHLNFYCRLADPGFRLESRTKPVQCIEPLLITHVASNHNLAADCEKVFNFGQAEYLVACQSHHLRNPWRNVWVVSNGHWNLNSEENMKIKEIKRKVWGIQIVYR